jgi:hypothetical protein
MTEENLKKANSITQMLMQLRREREVVVRMSFMEITDSGRWGWFGHLPGSGSSITFSKDSDIVVINAVKELVLARLDSKIAYWIDQLELL